MPPNMQPPPAGPAGVAADGMPPPLREGVVRAAIHISASTSESAWNENFSSPAMSSMRLSSGGWVGSLNGVAIAPFAPRSSDHFAVLGPPFASSSVFQK